MWHDVRITAALHGFDEAEFTRFAVENATKYGVIDSETKPKFQTAYGNGLIADFLDQPGCDVTPKPKLG